MDVEFRAGVDAVLYSGASLSDAFEINASCRRVGPGGVAFFHAHCRASTAHFFVDLGDAFEHAPDAAPGSGAFYLTLVPIRPRRRGERRSLRTFPGVSLRPSNAFNPRPRRLSTPLLTPFNSTSISFCAQEIDAQKKEEEEAKKEWEKARAELEAAREARTQPTTHDDLVAYFFATEFNEMEYEIVKQRPKARSISHWSPYDPVRVVNADP